MEEFFQLFKVPWEFYEEEKIYDTVIITDDAAEPPSAKLLIIFGSEVTPFDIEHNTHPYLHFGGVLLEHSHFQFPVYQRFAIFKSSNRSFIKIKNQKEYAGIEFNLSEQRILRIGYDLFDELSFLLSKGQTVDYAQIPTLEIHIAMLRNWILNSGLPLVEIPSFPRSYNFIVCLTHDVDFISIRSHKFDHSAIGFILRAMFPTHFRDFRSKIAWRRFIKNWKALFSLPGVYLGFFRDFWFQDLDRYSEIEVDACSTFFFIPFKDHPGDAIPSENYTGDTIKKRQPRYRSAQYDINNYRIQVEALIQKGHEVGVHGLDAWHNSKKGYNELQIIRQITGEDNIGIRMHWLYFSENSPSALDEAGFHYDSSIGYNDAVGYRSGTTQVFLLPGSSNVFELPLHLQDTAMFYRRRMSLSEAKALQLCKKVFGHMQAYGGVVTINWHTRSLSPERNWDDFYIELLKILKTENVWFATAKQAVNWFKIRRSIHFDDIEFSEDRVKIKISSSIDNNLPDLLIRLYYPVRSRKSESSAGSSRGFIDMPLSADAEREYVFEF